MESGERLSRYDFLPSLLEQRALHESLCSSLRSLSSCTSLESLRGGAPFRLPLWDRASAEFCFARSRDLLTRCPPRLDSSVELLESSEADETMSVSYNSRLKISDPFRNYVRSDKSDDGCWKIRKQFRDFTKNNIKHEELYSSNNLSNEGTVTKSLSTDSASTLEACPSITDLNESSTLRGCISYKRSGSLKGLSLSSLNECNDIMEYSPSDLNKSSYENIYKSAKSYESSRTEKSDVLDSMETNYSTNGFAELEKLEAELKKQENVDISFSTKSQCSAELKSLSKYLDKFPDLDDSPGQNFRSLDKTTLTYSPRSRNEFPSLREVSYCSEQLSNYNEKYPHENKQTGRFSFKQLEKHLDSLDLNKHSSENISKYEETSSAGRNEDLRKTEQVPSKTKQYIPKTPLFRRKLSQTKIGESSRRSTKSSPNSPSITSPKLYFRPRTNSLTEEKVRPLPSRRQSYNYSAAHYDSSSSDSEFDQPPSHCQGQQCPWISRRERVVDKPTYNWHSSSSSSSSPSDGYTEFSENFQSLSSHQVRTKF